MNIKKREKPVIGITLDLAVNENGYFYAKWPWYALRQNYADVILRAGGLPLMIPYQEDNIPALLDIIDGLLIPGGDGDVPPKLYNHELTKANVVLNGQRAEFEVKLTKAALERNLPFLGICNGMQILNVVLGGDLIQDIPLYHSNHINHKQPHPMNQGGHEIYIKENTILSSIIELGKDSIIVNSSHHQAIGNLGTGLIASAIAEDKIIEAIESSEHSFVMGVEWHPEFEHDNGVDNRLFDSFIDACKN